MEVAFSILLDSAGYNLVRKYQLKIRQLFQAKETLLLEPHSTIKYAFETNNFEGIEKYFDDVARTTEVFEIDIDGISAFEENTVVFLNIAKSEQLTNMHLRILMDLKQNFNASQAEFEGPSFHFHITLAYKDITKETFKKIMEHFKDENTQVKLAVKQLGLWVRIAPEDRWFLYKISSLSQHQ